MFEAEDPEKMQREYEFYRNQDIFTEFLNYIYKQNDNGINKYKKLENVPGVLYIHEQIHGVEGGHYWDQEGEDNTYETSTSENSVASNIANKARYAIEKLSVLELDTEKVKEWVEKHVPSSKYSYFTDYFQPEYYGNSSTYGIYKVDFNSLIECVCSESNQHIYKDMVSNFKPPVNNKNRFY